MRISAVDHKQRGDLLQKCLVNVIENPLGCYEPARYDGDRDRMMREVMSVYEPA